MAFLYTLSMFLGAGIWFGLANGAEMSALRGCESFDMSSLCFFFKIRSSRVTIGAN